jgi:hypothetical protein
MDTLSDVRVCFYMMALVAIFFVAKILRRHSIRGWRWRQAAQAAIHAVPGLVMLPF